MKINQSVFGVFFILTFPWLREASFEKVSVKMGETAKFTAASQSLISYYTHIY